VNEMCFVKMVANQKSSRLGGLWIFCCDITYQDVNGSQVIMTEV
jgi:hypothetical protein